MRSTTVKLKHPVTVKKHKYDKLIMRSPKVRDQITAQKKCSDGIELEITLFANLCEVSNEVIEELEMADYKKLEAAYKDFLS